MLPYFLLLCKNIDSLKVPFYFMQLLKLDAKLIKSYLKILTFPYTNADAMCSVPDLVLSKKIIQCDEALDVDICTL